MAHAWVRVWVLAISLLISGGAASAATTGQQKCINTNNLNLRKVAKRIAVEIDRCIKDYAKGKITGPGLCFEADPKGKILSAKNKTKLDFLSKCGGGNLASFAVTDPNTVNNAAIEKERGVTAVLFGADPNSALFTEVADKNASKCQQKIAKTVKKCQDKQLNEFNKCKKKALKAGADSGVELESCILDDPKGTIAKACDLVALPKLDKVRKDLTNQCDAKGVALDIAFPACSDPSIEGTHACLITQLQCLTCTAINTADGLNRDCDIVDDGVDNESCESGLESSTASLIIDPNDLIGGLLARGRVGDYLLENEKARFIIQKPGRNFSSGVGQYGGNLIDADLQRGGAPGKDLFEEVSLLVNLENSANYTSVVVLNDGSDGSAAVVRATGPDDLLDRINASSVIADFGFPFPAPLDDTDQPVTITTDYILPRGVPTLTIETTVTNTSGADIDLFLGDFLSSLAQEPFHSGYGVGEPLVTTSEQCDAPTICDFVAYSQGGAEKGGVSYAYFVETPNTTFFNTNGVQVSLLGRSAVLSVIGAQGPNFNVPAGSSVTVTRYIAVGDGDVASVLDERNRINGVTTGTVSGKVTLGGAPVEDVEITAMTLSAASGPGTAENVVSQFRTDPNGNFSGTLPVEDYELRANKDGHLFGSPDPGLIVVTDGASITQNFTLTAPATIDVSIVDANSSPIAGQVSVVGFDPSPDPGNSQLVLGLIANETGIFGDVTKDPLPYGLARTIFVDHSGVGSFAMEPGDYRFVVSHGTEYSAFTSDLTVSSGVTHPIAADVARVVDSTGYISGDFHVHSFDSVDSAVTRNERIISMLAVGMDFFTPSDHEFVSDFTPELTALGVTDLISVSPGNEITPFDYGHFGAFPRTVDPNQVNGGAVDWGRAEPPGFDFPVFGAFGLTPGEIYAAAEADPGDQMVMIHHVASFFDSALQFDTGVTPPVSNGDGSIVRLDPNIPNYWDEDFDNLEVWIETGRGQIFGNFLGENAGNWFNLLNQGSVHRGIADSDTHALFAVQAGYPRTFIASATDDAGAITGQDVADGLNSGNSFGTNSVFLDVGIEGDPNVFGGLGLGEPTLVKATGGSATVTIDIQSPDWAEFDMVEYYINSETIVDPNGRAGLNPLYRICPDVVQTDGVEFTVSSVPVNGKARLEATSTLALAGLTEDTWVIALVRGIDDISCPLFPIVAQSLDPNVNLTLADLKSCDAGDLGATALAFTNPLFIDVDGNGVYDPPGLLFQGSCP